MDWDMAINPREARIYFPGQTAYTTDFFIDSYQKTEVYHNNLRSADNSLRLEVPFNETFADQLKIYVDKDIKIEIRNADGSIDFTGYLRKNYTLEKQKRPRPISLEIVSPSFLLKKPLGPGNAIILKDQTVTQICTAVLAQAGFTNNSSITISDIIPIFMAEEDEQYYTILSDLLFEYAYTFDFDTTGAFILLPLFNKPTATPEQVFNKNNIREKLTQKIEERKTSANIRLEWSTLTKFNRVTIYENVEGRNAAYPDGCQLQVYPNAYLFGNEENRIDYDSSLGEVVWVDTIYQDFRMIYPLTVVTCDNLGKSCILSIRNSGNVAAYVTKLRIFGDAYIRVDGQITRSPGSGEEKTYELKYNHDAPRVDALAKDIAEYYAYSNLKVTLSSEDNYPVGSFVVIVEDYMGTIVGRITKKTTVLREFYHYEIESITEYNPVENIEVLMKPSGKMASLLAIPPDITAPTVPQIEDAVILANGTIEVTFDKSTDTESGVYFYNIYRCQSDTENGITDTPVVIYTLPDDGSESYTFIDQNAENKKWYFYAITAVDKANNESERSETRHIQSIVSSQPQLPYIMYCYAKPEGVQIEIYYVASYDAGKIYNTQSAGLIFRIQFSADGGTTWSDLAKVQGNVYTHTYENFWEINVANVENMKYRAYLLSVYGVESTNTVGMLNNKVRYDFSRLVPPLFYPSETFFTKTIADVPNTPFDLSQYTVTFAPPPNPITAVKMMVTIPLGGRWLYFALKASGGGGGGSGGNTWNRGRGGSPGSPGGNGLSLTLKTPHGDVYEALGGNPGAGGNAGAGGPKVKGGDRGSDGSPGEAGDFYSGMLYIPEGTIQLELAGSINLMLILKRITAIPGGSPGVGGVGGKGL
jgi:hypothetical protein